MNLPEIFSFPFFFLFFLPPKVSQEDPGIDNGGSAAGTAAGAATARGYGTIPATSGATRTRRFSTFSVVFILLLLLLLLLPLPLLLLLLLLLFLLLPRSPN